MYIEPNSVIKIYHSVPVNSNYEYTVYFESTVEQNNYFHSTLVPAYTLTNQSYQRVEKGNMRIAVKADNLYDCNYLAFRNTSFGSKWFYAFINSVEYINNETSEITFELDILQTYMFDITIRDCYVEREHSMTDEVGDNIVSESIEIGDHICTDFNYTNYFDKYSAFVAATTQEDEPSNAGLVNGLFSAVSYISTDVESASGIQSLLDFLKRTTDLNRQDSIVSIFLFPTKLAKISVVPPTFTYNLTAPTKIGNYTPKNKKLLTYPYTYLSVDCGNNGAVFRYEWFSTNNHNPKFVIQSCLTCNPQVTLAPIKYNMAFDGSAYTYNYVEELVMSGFPQIAWTIDSYRAWLAQEASGTALQGLGSLAAIGFGAATANPAAIAGGVLGLASTVNSAVISANRPPQTKGTNSGTIDVANRSKNFYFRTMQVTEQYAQIIDDYFNMYGYATNRVKTPNISSRPHWNYVKTKGCVINGSIPADDLKNICAIYDAGITFWKKPNEVGNYALDNSP